MSEYKQALLEYLKDATPDMWHQVAWNWNWDSGEEILAWIVRQPQCDKGTALLVYWYGGPRYLAQYAERESVNQFELPVYDLLREIEAKYTTEFYRRQKIKFDPHNDLNSDWTKEYNDKPLRRPIPEIMYQPSPGQPTEHQPLAEGYPEEVIAKVEKRR